MTKATDKLTREWAHLYRFAENIAAFTPYTIDSDDNQLEDAIATLNRLIADAKALTKG